MSNDGSELERELGRALADLLRSAVDPLSVESANTIGRAIQEVLQSHPELPSFVRLSVVMKTLAEAAGVAIVRLFPADAPEALRQECVEGFAKRLALTVSKCLADDAEERKRDASRSQDVTE